MMIELLLAAAVFLPQTDETTMHKFPLAEGEIGYVDNGNNTATMYVGNGAGQPMPIVDYSALRGYETKIIPRDQYTIVCDAGITYTATNDTWTCRGALGNYRVVITARPDVEIVDVDFKEHRSGESTIDTSHGVSCTYSDNVAIITFNVKAAGAILAVSDIVITRVALGAVHGVNDLTRMDFQCLDEFGTFSLGRLRYWVANLYNGNRGEDWARYPAKAPAHMGNQPIYFSKNTRYTLGVEKATNLVLRAGGHAVLDVRSTGNGKGGDRAFQITSIKTERAGETLMNVEMTFVEDIDKFDPLLIYVERCVSRVGSEYYRTNSWERVAIGDVLFFDHKVKVVNQPFIAKDPAFDSGKWMDGTVPVLYRVIYEGEIVDQIEVTFREDVKFEKKLIIKGDDDLYYEIRVNNGVLSAVRYFE